MKTRTSTTTSKITLTLTLAMATCVLAGLTTSCTLGSVGAAETVCDQAVDHLASCGVTDLPDTGECTEAKQRLASQILDQSCAAVSARSTFSGSSCSSIWSIFNPSCWGNSGSGSGSNNNTQPGGGCTQIGVFCFVDSDCCSHNCDWDNSTCQPAGQGGSWGSGPGSPRCYCDSLCAKNNDCCPGC